MSQFNATQKNLKYHLPFHSRDDIISMDTNTFVEVIYLRRSSSETRKKILTTCVRLFLEQGYKNTSVSQIVDEAGVARGSYLNLFPTKDKILLDLTETMFVALQKN